MFNCEFASVVAAFGADSVVDVVCTTVGADSQSGHFSHVMRTTFGLSGVRLSSFRMCHNYLTFKFLLLSYLWAVGLCLNRFRVLPLRYIGGLGEVRPFEDCNHHPGDDAQAADL